MTTDAPIVKELNIPDEVAQPVEVPVKQPQEEPVKPTKV